MAALHSPVVLIVSPHAGHAEGQADVEAALRAAGVEVGQVIPVSELDECAPQGQAWRTAGYAAAVAAGGDGTVGAVASQVAGSGLPLGILPLGTANDVARSLEIPLEIAAACEVVAHGLASQLDLGYARPAATQPGAVAALQAAEVSGGPTPKLAQSEARAQAGAYFLHALTLGLNVEFARLATDAARRRRWGPLTYAASAIEALSHYRPVGISVRLEGVAAGAAGVQAASMIDVPRESGADATSTIACEVVQLAAVVTPVFGGSANFRLPGVRLRDQLLDVIVVEALEPDRLRALVEHLIASWHPAPPEVSADAQRPPDLQQILAQGDHQGLWRFQARTAIIEQPAGLDVTLDGEVRARTPLELGVAPDALTVLLPADRAEEVLGE